MSSSPEPSGPAGTDGPGRPGGAPPVCPRHPDRVSYVRCQRCERPVCPDCQRPAAVGVHCVDCVRAQPGVRARTVAGAPVGDDRPLVTQGLVVLLGVVWLAQLAQPLLTGTLGFVPVVSRAEPWRFLTAALVHLPGGLPFHLLVNAFLLWSFGRTVEALTGRWRYGALLLLSALASWVGVLWLTAAVPGLWDRTTVGASGVVFGVVGAAAVLERLQGRSTRSHVTVLGVLAVTGFVLGGTSWQVHLGGLLGGLLVALVLVRSPRRHRTRWQLAGLVAVLLLLVGATLLRWALVGPALLY